MQLPVHALKVCPGHVFLQTHLSYRVRTEPGPVLSIQLQWTTTNDKLCDAQEVKQKEYVYRGFRISVGRANVV